MARNISIRNRHRARRKLCDPGRVRRSRAANGNTQVWDQMDYMAFTLQDLTPNEWLFRNVIHNWWYWNAKVDSSVQCGVKSSN